MSYRDKLSNENQLYHVFQPVYHIKSGELYGYETLLRSRQTKNPQKLFQQALRSSKLFELDTASIALALHHLNTLSEQMDPNLHFLLNIYPSTLASPAFIILLKELLAESAISPKQLIFELNESEMIEDIPLMCKHVYRLHELGIRIALDDIGKGVVPVRQMLELQPDLIKVDRFYADNLAASKEKQQAVTQLIQYCSNHQIYMALEGIEREEDLYTARKLGVPLVQGYLLGRPAALASFA